MEIKTKRSLSGIFFRWQNPDTKEWENWCFEDLPETEQDMIMSKKGPEWIKELCKLLANNLNKIAEQFDITAEKEEEAE